MTFREIAEKHGTDKATHGYMEFYEQMITTPPKKMLEIGVFKGASIKMWKELFPDTELHVIDLFLDPDNLTEQQAQELGAITHMGDQGDWVFLNGIDIEFDLIIDDGSHNADHQRISLGYLFGRNLIPGGKYFVEDLHCNLDPFYYGTYVKSYEDTLHYYFLHGRDRGVREDFADYRLGADNKIVCITKPC